jgi:hypothetical protein
MFKLFGNKHARSDGISEPTIFDQQDIGQILSTFNLDSSSSQHPLLLTSSKSSLVSTEKIISSIRSWSDRSTRRRQISEIAYSFEVEPDAILTLIRQQNDWSLLSADSVYLLSKDEQRGILQRLSVEADRTFVKESDFCRKESIPIGTVEILGSRYAGNANLSYFNTSDEDGPFIVSAQKRQSIEKSILNTVEEAEQAVSTTSWDSIKAEGAFGPEVFPGLNLDQSLQLCERIKAANSNIGGSFQVTNDEIIYIPLAFLVARRDVQFASFESGQTAFLNIDDLIGKSPEQFGDVNEFKKFVKTRQLDLEVNSESRYVISDKWIDNQVNRIIKTFETEDTVTISVGAMWKRICPNETKLYIGYMLVSTCRDSENRQRSLEPKNAIDPG